MVWKIQLGKYLLQLLDSVEITESVDLLSDTAVIKLPATNVNKQMDLESKIARGDRVLIQLGYDDQLRDEFAGFIERIDTDDASISIVCEDGIFLTRVGVKDREMMNCTTKQIAQYVVDEVNRSLPANQKLSLSCDYDLQYDKFIISKATGRDVLNRLQEDTKANIYMKDRNLHFHPAYLEKFGEVTYDFAVNIEKSELKYRHANDRKYEVEVEGISRDGKRSVITMGTIGGEKRSIKIAGVIDQASLRKRGEEELKYLVFEGYEGSITGWLSPECHAGYSARIIDQEYEYKEGTYYVVSVTTGFSSAGGSRKIQLGRKLA